MKIKTLLTLIFTVLILIACNKSEDLADIGKIIA